MYILVMQNNNSICITFTERNGKLSVQEDDEYTVKESVNVKAVLTALFN